MADSSRRLAQNVDEGFFVDETCIDCDLCREIAPAHFKRDDRARVSFVFQQPRNDDERADCDRAARECPVEAIGGVLNVAVGEDTAP